MLTSLMKISLRKAALALAALAIPMAQGQTYQVLHTFNAQDGANPYATLVWNGVGTLFGTTYQGGSGAGVVFKITPAGSESTFYAFPGAPDGDGPYAGLTRDSKGNLYGTATFGGTGNGIVYKLNTAGQNTVLYSFTGGKDGAYPQAGVVGDSAGNLYGAAASGGAHGGGTVFTINPKGVETTLYSFTGGKDGYTPEATLIRDSSGNLYGTTVFGGGSGACHGGCGVVFKVDKTGAETVLYRFQGPGDGANPLAPLVRDKAGNLYGTTAGGGNGRCNGGCGVVFKLSAAGAETVLYAFTGQADGAGPMAGLKRTAKGRLYGTAFAGGNAGCAGNGSCGVVFELTNPGSERVLYRFTGGADGASPKAGLVMDAAGNIYGTASAGGNNACGGGCGVVFKIAP